MLLKKNKNLNDENIQNKEIINQLKDDFNNIQKQYDFNINNKDNIIDDLKKQIDILKEEIEKIQNDKIKLNDILNNEKNSNN